MEVTGSVPFIILHDPSFPFFIRLKKELKAVEGKLKEMKGGKSEKKEENPMPKCMTKCWEKFQKCSYTASGGGMAQPSKSHMCGCMPLLWVGLFLQHRCVLMY